MITIIVIIFALLQKCTPCLQVATTPERCHKSPVPGIISNFVEDYLHKIKCQICQRKLSNSHRGPRNDVLDSPSLNMLAFFHGYEQEMFEEGLQGKEADISVK